MAKRPTELSGYSQENYNAHRGYHNKSDEHPHGVEKPFYRNRGKLEFDLSHQYRLIHDRGIKVEWEKSFICPCRTKMTKSPDPSCPICHGRGIGYLPKEDLIIAIQSQDRSVSNIDLGMFDSGTATGTTMPDEPITFRDRISIPEVDIAHSLLFDVSSKRIKNGFHVPYDIKEILYAVTDNGDQISENMDYTVDYEKDIIKPKEHLKGKNISINISTILRYIVIDLLKESRYQITNQGKHNEEFTNLAKKLLLKREDAWVNSVDFDYDDTNKEEEPEEDWTDPKRGLSNGSGFFNL